MAPGESAKLLSRNALHPHHNSARTTFSVVRAVERFAGEIGGHQQVADAYFLGLAIHQKGIPVAMDSSIHALFGRAGKKAGDLAVI